MSSEAGTQAKPGYARLLGRVTAASLFRWLVCRRCALGDPLGTGKVVEVESRGWGRELGRFDCLFVCD